MALVACPKCRAKLQVPSTKASSLRCPKCQKLIFLEEPDDELDNEDEDELDEHPRKKSRIHHEDDEDDRPRRKSTKRGKHTDNTAILGAVIGGGVLLLVLVIGVTIYLVSRSKTDSTDSPPSKSSSSPFGLPASRDDDFSGPWPLAANALPPGDTIVLHITGVADQGTADAISERINELVPPAKNSRRSISTSFRLPRMTVIINPIKSAEEFAKLIDFGQVKSIDGRVISIKGQKMEIKKRQ
jgi:hypothetical protein